MNHKIRFFYLMLVLSCCSQPATTIIELTLSYGYSKYFFRIILY